MKTTTLAILGLLIFQLAPAQVGIGTTTPQAQLDIAASSAASPSSLDGLLIPRIDAFPATSPTSAQNGMLVFLRMVSGTNQPGFYYWHATGGIWVSLSGSVNSWNTNGNNAVSGTNFIGTVNAQDVDFRTNNLMTARLTQKGQLEFLNTGQSIFIGEDAGKNDDLTTNQNVYIGYQSGRSATTGYSNSAVGFQSLRSLTAGYANTAFGHSAMANSTTAINNTALGYNSLKSGNGNHNTAAGSYAMESNVSGYANVAVGTRALAANTTGFFNTASGYNAMLQNTTGSHNTASGMGAMIANTTGYRNTASGASAMLGNTIGFDNTANGFSALSSNTEGTNNTATGSMALSGNTTGINNTASGRNSLLISNGNNNSAFGTNVLSSNTTGGNNTASGVAAMYMNSGGGNNTASGGSALYYNSIGNNNTAFGLDALRNNSTGNFNTGVGHGALILNETGIRLTGVGQLSNVASPGLINGTVIGASAVLNASHKVRLGAATVTVVEGAVPYSNPSDARFKFDVKDDVPGIDFIMKLRPVTYKFDSRKFQQHVSGKADSDFPQAEFDAATNVIRSGFLAQDVEKAARESGYDFDGVHVPDPSNPNDNYSIAYSQFVMPMVKAMQEQQHELESVKRENTTLKQQVENQAELLNALEKRLSALEKK